MRTIAHNAHRNNVSLASLDISRKSEKFEGCQRTFVVSIVCF